MEDQPTGQTAKQLLRQKLKEQRDEMGELQRYVLDSRITKHVCESQAWKQAQYVCVYASFGTEVDTWDIMARAWASYKHVLLPRVVEGTRQMEWYAVRATDALEGSVWGIAQPIASSETKVDVFEVCKTSPVLAIVPGLSFDKQGFRIGYGGGYYDEFLAHFSGTSMGLIRSDWFVEALPELEAHDVAVNAVATERGIENLHLA